MTREPHPHGGGLGVALPRGPLSALQTLYRPRAGELPGGRVCWTAPRQSQH